MRTATKAKLMGLGVVAAALAFFLDPHCDIDYYNATVTDKQVKRVDGQDSYLIFTILDDGKPRVFKNTDSRLYFKYNSSDLNALVRVNHRYRFKTVGWRWNLESWYENILKAEPLPDLPDSSALRRSTR